MEWGKKHFGCEALEGVELEDDGGSGTAGSHWQMRSLLNDYMVGINIHTMYPTVKSVFTLALLEDTGWYFADFTRADMALKWGYNRGCDFLHSCDANTQPGFCMNHASPSPDAEECSSDASWVDSEGDGCQDYFDHPWWCDHAEDWAVDGVDASLKCCCLLYTSPSPRDQRGSRMPSSA